MSYVYLTLPAEREYKMSDNPRDYILGNVHEMDGVFKTLAFFHEPFGVGAPLPIYDRDLPELQIDDHRLGERLIFVECQDGKTLVVMTELGTRWDFQTDQLVEEIRPRVCAEYSAEEQAPVWFRTRNDPGDDYEFYSEDPVADGVMAVFPDGSEKLITHPDYPEGTPILERENPVRRQAARQLDARMNDGEVWKWFDGCLSRTDLFSEPPVNITRELAFYHGLTSQGRSFKVHKRTGSVTLRKRKERLDIVIRKSRWQPRTSSLMKSMFPSIHLDDSWPAEGNPAWLNDESFTDPKDLLSEEQITWAQITGRL